MAMCGEILRLYEFHMQRAAPGSATVLSNMISTVQSRTAQEASTPAFILGSLDIPDLYIGKYGKF